MLAASLLLFAGSQFKPDMAPILFIGNSFTYFNNLPVLVKEISETGVGGLKVEPMMVVQGGATLKDLWNGGKALEAIKSKAWRYVVLQEQSSLGMTYVVNGVIQIVPSPQFEEYARKFDAEIKKIHAKTVLYETWSDKDAPEQNQAGLSNEYTKVARDLHAILVPAGADWQQMRAQDPNFNLYFEDNHHPGPAGSYLVATAFMWTLFPVQRNPLPLKVLGQAVNDDGVPTGEATSVLAELPADKIQEIDDICKATAAQAKASNGYLTTSAPKIDPLPQLPQAKLPKDRSLGTNWKGSLKLYPDIYGMTTFAMAFSPARNGLQVHVTVVGQDKKLFDIGVAPVKLTANGIEFMIDRDNVSGSGLQFQGVWVDDTLQGIATFKGSPQFQGVGTWSAKRE